ncbi:glycosyltransferase [Fusobacterium sp. IOR10]|uniref:glycosyltransferase n=1 Tax=Fusobacterium sp. IOR10 TaxID=2665157 RepID=UPI0013D7D40B|nr:glycosyltransferase [Fusobacterium sp. IOR10]
MKTFLFIYGDFNLGGIQKYLIKLIRLLKKDNIRIIWICKNRELIIDKGFEKDLLDGYVEIILMEGYKKNWVKNLKLKFSAGEKIVAFSFSFYDFLHLEMIKKKYNYLEFNTFFWVAHFKGKNLFFEENFPKILRKKIKDKTKEIYYNMDKNNNIFYGNKSHFEGLTNHYNIFSQMKGKIYDERSSFETGLFFSEKDAKQRYKNNKYNILSITRFEFPHKAYIFGLINSFCLLKEKYKQLKLTIIGYGGGKELLKAKIAGLPFNIKKDIILLNKVSYDELHNFFRNTYIYVGVAGSIRDASRNGVISIPVRHYSYNCEGYGFLPESKFLTTSNITGEPIEKYLEYAFNLSEKEYILYSKKSYSSFIPKNPIYESERIFKNNNISKSIVNFNNINKYLFILDIYKTNRLHILYLFKSYCPDLYIKLKKLKGKIVNGK